MNTNGNPAQRMLVSSGHEKGKYHFYCGKKRDTKCPSKVCDDLCGPSDGCNCTACANLDQVYDGFAFPPRFGFPPPYAPSYIPPVNPYSQLPPVVPESPSPTLYPVLPSPQHPVQLPPQQHNSPVTLTKSGGVYSPYAEYSTPPQQPAYSYEKIASPSIIPTAVSAPSFSDIKQDVQSTSKGGMEGGGGGGGGDEQNCVICMERPKNAILVHGSIGHQCCCFECGNDIYSRGQSCPVCRAPIIMVVRTYK